MPDELPCSPWRPCTFFPHQGPISTKATHRRPYAARYPPEPGAGCPHSKSPSASFAPAFAAGSWPNSCTRLRAGYWRFQDSLQAHTGPGKDTGIRKRVNTATGASRFVPDRRIASEGQSPPVRCRSINHQQNFPSRPRYRTARDGSGISAPLHLDHRAFGVIQMRANPAIPPPLPAGKASSAPEKYAVSATMSCEGEASGARRL